jgi:hypothetical protein
MIKPLTKVIREKLGDCNTWCYRTHQLGPHPQDTHVGRRPEMFLEVGCGQWWTPVFCNVRCRIRIELYEFLIWFPHIIAVMDEIDMRVSQLFLLFLLYVSVHETTDLCLRLLLSVRHNLWY